MADNKNFVDTAEMLKQQEYASAVRSLISDKELLAHVITLGCQQNEADS